MPSFKKLQIPVELGCRLWRFLDDFLLLCRRRGWWWAAATEPAEKLKKRLLEITKWKTASTFFCRPQPVKSCSKKLLVSAAFFDASSRVPCPLSGSAAEAYPRKVVEVAEAEDDQEEVGAGKRKQINET
jgi:hypothetical protein